MTMENQNGNGAEQKPGAQSPAVAEKNHNSLQFGEEIKKMIATAGTLELNKAQKAALYSPVKDKDVYIKPDGLIYLSWIKYSERLTKAFGGTGWTMVPEGPPKYNGTSLIVWGFHLVIKGVYCGVAYGEQKYTKDMSFMSYGEACEGAKSNALMRLCKALGIGLELWDRDFIDRWLSEHAEWYWDNNSKKKWKLKKDAFGKTPAKPTEAKPEAAPQAAATPKPAAEKKAEVRQEEIPLEEILDETNANGQVASVPTGATGTAMKGNDPVGVTPRVNEDIKKIQATETQKALSTVFTEIKKKYPKENYTPTEVEALRITANQHFVSLGAKNIGKRR